MAEEVIQAYITMATVLKQYAVKEIEELQIEKWQPLIIKKSEFNKSKFVFESGGATFGYQSNEDRFYANQLFRFGFPKETIGNKVFSFSPDFNLRKFGMIANRIISPSLALIPGVNVLMGKDNTLFFNIDLFANDYIPRANVVGELGEPETYKDSEGRLIPDELIVMWVYQAELDVDAVYDNFGVLLDLPSNLSENYKDLLKAMLNLSVEGPTIKAIATCLATLSGTPVVIEAVEKVEDTFVQENYKFLITDKNTYRIASDQHFIDNAQIGNLLHGGEILTTNIKIVDVAIDPSWWKHELTANKLAFPSYIFASSSKNQLFFENAIKLLTYTEGLLRFPVLGRSEDVEAFQAYINQPDNGEEEGNQTKILRSLSFNKQHTGALAINPVDFLFNHFFKNNTLLLKLDFYSEAQIHSFFSLFPFLKEYLPPHVYLLLYMRLQLNQDELSNLNNGLTIPDFGTQRFSLDGSNRLTGARPVLPTTDLEYYKDYKNRLFCVSLGPYRNPIAPHYPPTPDDQPLHYLDNVDFLPIDNDTEKGIAAGIKSGLLRTEIPTSVKPPGERWARLPSTREVPSILLIDF